MVRKVTRTIYTAEVCYKMYVNETEEIKEGTFIKHGITHGNRETDLAQARRSLEKSIGEYGKILDCQLLATYADFYTMPLEEFILHAERDERKRIKIR